MAGLLFDCYYGVSGDMIVGALLDLGADHLRLKRVLDSLHLHGYDIEISKVDKKGIYATDFLVKLDTENHDHDMSYLYGKADEKVEIMSTRNLPTICALIDRADMTDRAKAIAKDIFTLVAKAESKAHKIDLDEVIFHETGAMDSIIDIVSIAVLYDSLNIDAVYVANLREGIGQIRTRVGMLPIPTPAVKNVLDMYNIAISRAECNVELITPTGISALAVLSNFKQLKEHKNFIKTGYGAGKREYAWPCVLRVSVFE